MKVCGDQLNTIDDDTFPYMWHKRLAHMSEKGLQLVAKSSFIPMAKGKNTYDYCLFGKQHKVSCEKKSIQKLEKLKLVYYNVYGPLEVDTLGANKHFIIFINDASQKTYTCFTQKFMYSNTSKNFMPWWRGRLDNGGEYIFKVLKNIAQSMEPRKRRH